MCQKCFGQLKFAEFSLCFWILFSSYLVWKKHTRKQSIISLNIKEQRHNNFSQNLCLSKHDRKKPVAWCLATPVTSNNWRKSIFFHHRVSSYLFWLWLLILIIISTKQREFSLQSQKWLSPAPPSFILCVRHQMLLIWTRSKILLNAADAFALMC